jgi:hypothetical protein
MYVWHPDAPVGSVKSSKRSERIKMVVVANEQSGTGQWQSFSRNIAEDFAAAFGEPPGTLIGIGVLTDTGSFGSAVEAWYGDIELHRTPHQASAQRNR